MQGTPNRARLPIRTRVNLAFALAVGVLLAIAAASYQSVTSLAETGQWIGHTHEVLAAIDAVAATATTAEAGTRGYALTGEERRPTASASCPASPRGAGSWTEEAEGVWA
jgi:methyl-accepting chemotaxis protein